MFHVPAVALLLALQAPSSGGERWGADYFPNVELTTHEGRTVRFFDDLIEGKVVVINFIYTSCPDACPLETARLAEVQELLGERVGRDVFMYSISIDPARDTVEALAAYAERFGVGPGWLLLRGSEEDVRRVREKLGMIARDEKVLADHTLSVVVGNQATGRWMRRSPFENAFVLANEIGSSLHNWKLPPPPIEDQDGASLGAVSRGEQLFRTRCSACHLIGTGDGLARLGPNLQGVVEWRDRAWLRRWLAEPDRMLAEGDPLAQTLLEAYRRVPMPNMRLNEVEVDAVIEFMGEESRRTLDEAPAAAAAAPKERACCRKSDALVLESREGSADDSWEVSPEPPADDSGPDSAALSAAPPPAVGVRGGALVGFAALLACGGLVIALTREARARPGA